jgi:glyoxylase-like metal-dependent hydrolase (beta-lactamase superfamily II)
MSAHFHVIPSGSIQCNAIVVWDEDSKEAALIDPTDDARGPLAFVAQKQLKLTEVLLTHGHFDHSADTERAMTAAGKTARLHPLDHALYRHGPEQARLFGCQVTALCQAALEPLTEGDEFTLGNSVTLKTLFVPGHSEGSMAFFVPQGPWVFSGDVLFAGSVGRTDLPGGSFVQLQDSIRNKLYQLPDDCIVVPGHGPKTTIGQEKRYNSFVRAE